MSDKINSLTDIEIDEISVVKRGANRKNKVLFFKSDEGELNMEKSFEEILEELVGHPEGPAIFDDLKKAEELLKQAKLSAKAMNAVKGALRMLNAFKDEVPKDVMSKLAGLAGYGYAEPARKDDDTSDKPDEEPKEPAQKSAVPEEIPEPIRKELTRLEKALEEKDGEINKLKSDNEEIKKESRRKDILRKVADKFSAVPIGSDDLTDMLMSLDDNPEMLEKIEKLLLTTNEIVAESIVFKELGAGGGGAGGDAMQQIEKKATEIRKADPSISQEKAVAIVMKENPALYDQYEAEKRGRTN